MSSAHSTSGDDTPGETLAEQVYRRLSAAILEGELAPGSKISEPALARQYGVSRGPLREALHRLQERKLITRRPNQGPRVVKPTPESLLELFHVREALEGMAARLAATHITNEEVEQLRAVTVASTQNREDVGRFLVYDNDFHFAIARFSRSEMLANLLCTDLYPLLRLYREMLPNSAGRARVTVEHDHILAAIEDRDPDLAEILMRRHIAAARVRREKIFAGQAEPEAPRKRRKGA